jgi:hypothetical protein
VTEPVHQPAPLKKSGRPLIVYIIFAILVMIAALVILVVNN